MQRNWVHSFSPGTLLLSFLFLFITLTGCVPEGEKPKKFMFDHPEVTLQLNSTGEIYNKYSSEASLTRLKSGVEKGEILTVRIDEIPYELLATSSYQRIGPSNYYVRFKDV